MEENHKCLTEQEDGLQNSGLTLRQKIVFPVLVVIYFNSAMIMSMQAPFYPAEATRKNATATEFSLVLASYDFIRVIFTPIVASHVVRIGLPVAFNIGVILEAISVGLFGFLEFVRDRTGFIGLSFLLRITEAMGASGSALAIYSLMGKEFPNSVGTVSGLLETTFGFGLSVGPVVGSLLYTMGGFVGPFVTVSTFHMFMCFLVNVLVLDTCKEQKELIKKIKMVDKEHSKKYQLKNLIKIPSVMFFPICMVVAASSEGFLAALLELHLRQFHLSSLTVGLTFFTFSGSYAISAVIIALIIEKFSFLAIRFILMSGTFTAFAFSILVPLPFLQLSPSLHLTLIALVILGIGHAGAFIAIYNLAFEEAKLHGFEDVTYTSALVSSLILTAISVGISSGAGISGLLFDHFGFSVAAAFVIIPNILMTVGSIFFIHWDKVRKLKLKVVLRASETSPLLH